MPPNKKGGKNYKKGKHATEEPVIFEKHEDQMYGRIVKLLGGCNALVYCNDNRERLCHICGSMRKKVWLATGDIVLISLRTFDENAPISSIQKGDICAKYDPKVIYKLREKDKTINEKLFINVDKSGNIPDDDNNEGFIFDDDGNDEEDDDTDEKPKYGNEIMPANRALQKKAMMRHDDDEDDLNIDDI
jgi:translation initiation factor 1A